MAEFMKGEVVVVPFPFSDLTSSKRRPALVLARITGDDIILCQITSKMVRDEYSIMLDDEDFESGSLYQPSNIRPNRIFTADRNIIVKRVGKLTGEKTVEVINGLISILRQ